MTQWLVEFLQQYHPVTQALIATVFTWLFTAAGAAPVLFAKRINQRMMDGMLGLAAGVMIAASYWSLLAPAIEMSGGDWKPAAIGFLAGGFFLYLVDKILPHLHIGLENSEAEGIKTSWRRSVLLVSAVTLHNIPEALAVGVAFGAVAQAPDAIVGREMMPSWRPGPLISASTADSPSSATATVPRTSPVLSLAGSASTLMRYVPASSGNRGPYRIPPCGSAAARRTTLPDSASV